MNKLNNFIKSQLRSIEAKAIKGGIRFITNSHAEYREQRRALMRDNIPFTEEVCHGNSSSYCIEW